MGHQESLVRSNNGDIQIVIDKIKSLGELWFKERWIKPFTIVTLKKSLTINIDSIYEDVKPIKLKFKKGEKFICFAGERQYQRSVEKMFGEDKGDIEILFIDYFPAVEMFKPNSDICYEEEFQW